MKIISNWTFDTSSTGSAGFALFSVSGGMIRLKKPDRKTTVDFSYRGIGGGPSVGIKHMPSGTFAPTDFTSAGIVFKMPACQNQELKEDDFLGPCMYVDAGAGIIAGGGGTILFLGLPSINFLPITMMPSMAKACIPMIGFSLVKHAAIGVTFSTGQMYLS
jgi:hypothetical protein